MEIKDISAPVPDWRRHVARPILGNLLLRDVYEKTHLTTESVMTEVSSGYSVVRVKLGRADIF